MTAPRSTGAARGSSPRHDAILALAGEVGVTTYKTYVAGAHLLVDGERIRRYKGLIPKISPLAIVTLALAQTRLNRMARRVPLDEPWSAKHAAEWDTQTVASWLERSGVRTEVGRGLFEMAVRGCMTSDLGEVSLLHLLLLAHAHGGIDKLFSIEGGAQENMVDGGAGEVARRVAAELGDAVRLGAPVRTVTQHDDRAVVDADGVTVTARAVIVAVPPVLALEIGFDPPLPEDRLALYRGAPGGPETKTLVVYDEPFWRADGFSGQTSEPGSAAEVTIDASPAAGSPGVLACFTFGPVALRAGGRPIPRSAGRRCWRRCAPGSGPGPVRPATSSRRRGGPRSGPAAARPRTSTPGSSPATAPSSASRSAGCTGRAPRPPLFRTAPSTARCGRASGLPPRSSTGRSLAA